MPRTYHNADLAVALEYDGNNAPKITAKGEGLTAERILEIAERHGIPLRSEPELARILARVPLGEEIPRELYVAVAEVIAFAYFLSGKSPYSTDHQ
ncbi:MAG: EscU/YscU/HrcU family type III secretion system export apparatus switch protein [Gammaproteobacteria bacterium]